MLLKSLILLAVSWLVVAQNCGPNTVSSTCAPCYEHQKCLSTQDAIFCTQQCRDGCKCADNYYRNCTGDCVPLSKCPKACPKNEFFNCCGTGCPNLELCPEFQDPNQLACAAVCRPKCTCYSGYCRNKLGACVLRK